MVSKEILKVEIYLEVRLFFFIILFLALCIDDGRVLTLVLQENNDLRLYIDTDNNSGTGTQVAGMGADLIWNFGQRSGSYNLGSIGWDDIGVVASPAYEADEFELSIRRDATPGRRLGWARQYRVGGLSSGAQLPLQGVRRAPRIHPGSLSAPRRILPDLAFP